MKKTLLFTIFVLVFAVAACKPLPPFHQNTLPNDAGKISRALKMIELPTEKPLNATGKPLVIFQQASNRTAIAVDALSGKELWRTPTPNALSRYVITGNYVVYLDKNQGITALDVQTGKQVWTSPVPPQQTFMGLSAAPNGKIAYVTNFKPAGDPINQISTLTILSSSGQKIWSLEAGGRMGTPVITNDVVIVPYRSQHLVLLSTSKPVELARILIPRGEVRYMIATSQGIFFGDNRGLFRLSDNIVEDVKKPPMSFLSEIRNIEYRYSQDHYDVVSVDYSAYDVRSLLANWGTNTKGPVPQGDHFVIHMFKYFLGFSVTQDQKAVLQWAIMHPFGDDIVGSTIVGEHVFYAKANGSLECLRVATGERIWRTQPLGIPMRGVTFDLGAMNPTISANVETPLPLLDALTSIANDPDSRFPLAKRMAIDALAVVGGAGVGRLIKMLTDPQSSPELREKAAKDLISRPDPKGIPLYLSLLQQPYDYIKGTRPQAVEVMAEVLGQLKSKEAVPVLLQLLTHPHTTVKELVAITNALLSIGDTSIIRPFREFLLTYRADPAFAQDIHALQKMAQALFQFGGPAERQVLVFLAEDNRTLPRLQEYILRILDENRQNTSSTAKP